MTVSRSLHHVQLRDRMNLLDSGAGNELAGAGIAGGVGLGGVLDVVERGANDADDGDLHFPRSSWHWPP